MKKRGGEEGESLDLLPVACCLDGVAWYMAQWHMAMSRHCIGGAHSLHDLASRLLLVVPLLLLPYNYSIPRYIVTLYPLSSLVATPHRPLRGV